MGIEVGHNIDADDYGKVDGKHEDEAFPAKQEEDEHRADHKEGSHCRIGSTQIEEHDREDYVGNQDDRNPFAQVKEAVVVADIHQHYQDDTGENDHCKEDGIGAGDGVHDDTEDSENDSNDKDHVEQARAYGKRLVSGEFEDKFLDPRDHRGFGCLLLAVAGVVGCLLLAVASVAGCLLLAVAGVVVTVVVTVVVGTISW